MRIFECTAEPFSVPLTTSKKKSASRSLAYASEQVDGVFSTRNSTFRRVIVGSCELGRTSQTTWIPLTFRLRSGGTNLWQRLQKPLGRLAQQQSALPLRCIGLTRR